MFTWHIFYHLTWAHIAAVKIRSQEKHSNAGSQQLQGSFSAYARHQGLKVNNPTESRPLFNYWNWRESKNSTGFCATYVDFDERTNWKQILWKCKYLFAKQIKHNAIVVSISLCCSWYNRNIPCKHLICMRNVAVSSWRVIRRIYSLLRCWETSVMHALLLIVGNMINHVHFRKWRICFCYNK